MNCEQSIQNQFHDLLHEVTVVDDGLTDRADALIQKYWDVMDRYGLTDPEDTPFIAEGSGCTIFCAEGKGPDRVWRQWLIRFQDGDRCEDRIRLFENACKVKPYLAQWSHKYPKFLGCGEIDKTPFMVSEYVDGYSPILFQGQKKGLEISKLLARELAEIEAHGLLHLDIKPRNYLVSDADSNVTLIDWEFAQDCGAGVGLPGSWKFQGGNRLIGTVLYMAPEQALPEECTTGTESYQLACNVAHLVTGQSPHHQFYDPTSKEFRRTTLDIAVAVTQYTAQKNYINQRVENSSLRELLLACMVDKSFRPSVGEISEELDRIN